MVTSVSGHNGGDLTKFEVDAVMQDIVSDDNPPLWHPATAECLSEVELSQYLLIASSCVVGGGSHNEEVALEILQKHEGNVQNALQELLSPSNDNMTCYEDELSLFSSQEGSDSEDEMTSVSGQMPSGGELSNLNINLISTKNLVKTQHSTSQPWQPFEVDLFYEGLVRYHKDFNKVSKHVGTKSVKNCVEFYYLWKNICLEESQSFKSLFAQTSLTTTSSTTMSTSATLTSSTATSSTTASATSDSTTSGGSSTSSSMTDMTLNHHHHHHHHHHEGNNNFFL